MTDDVGLLSRRSLIGAGAALAASGSLSARMATRGPIRLLAGTYTGEGGKGLYPVAFVPDGDQWVVGNPTGAIANASFGVRSRQTKLFYFLDENARGTLGIWRMGRDWQRVGLVDTAGADPCHLALDAAGRHLAVANYSSGNIALYTLDAATGLPVGPPTVRNNTGHGPNSARQSGPHAHWVGFAPDGDRLYSVDLGTDQVLSYALDLQRGAVGQATSAFHAPGGSGPRHMAFHPTRTTAYLVSELGNTITVLRRLPDGLLTAEQTVSTLPAGFTGPSYAAHIAVNRAGTRLYVSNRGHDSLAVFTIDATGHLTLLQHVSTQGSWPRFFLLMEDDRQLFVANQRAGTIVALTIAADGQLVPTASRATVPGVTFIAAA